MGDDEAMVVGSSVRIWGTIKSELPVDVLGFVDGGVLAPKVVVAAQAMVIGDIVAVTAIINGHVKGNVFADHLTLNAGSSVEGEIHYTELDLKEGSYFEGKSRRHETPRRLVARLSVYDHSEAL